MTSKADLAKENQKTREVKEREDTVKEKGKEIVHDTKKKVEEISSKTEDLEIKDVPDLLPSAKRIDQKLKDAKDSVEDARNAQLGDVDLTRYPRIQQVFKDTERIIDDNRGIVKKMNEDNTLGDTIQASADFASLIKDQSVITLDKLWTNWAGLLTVVAGTSAGSWKQIIQESGHLLNQLQYTQDFVKLLSDLQQTLWSLSKRATKDEPIGEKLAGVNAEWEKQRTQLLEDWKRIWAVLNESPMWKQLVAKGTALKNTAAKTLEDTKEKVEEAAEEVKDSEETKKLKKDFKDILQLIVGKDGPDVQEFLDYCAAAYSDIIENEDYSTWASEMNECFQCLSSTEDKSSAEYQKAMEKMQEQTKKLLDETVNNQNLKSALRESRKLLRSAKHDPATKKLLADSNKLLRHISDKKGVNIMDPQLLNEIRAVIVPLLMDHLDNTPLPDFHGKDSNALGTFDYQLSGIRLATSGLIPDKIKVEFRYKAEANPSKLKMNYQHMYMYLEASDIQLAFKDVKWHYNRHTIPRFSDNGTIDFATAKKGIQIRIKAELHDYQAPEHAHSLGELLKDPKDKHMFSVLRAECDIDDFHVRVSDSGAANVFYEMLAGIWGTKIKHQIECLIENKMNLLAQKFDSQLYDTCRRATQPSLAEETKEALLSAGQAAGESIKETVEEAKKSLQSM